MQVIYVGSTTWTDHKGYRNCQIQILCSAGEASELELHTKSKLPYQWGVSLTEDERSTITEKPYGSAKTLDKAKQAAMSFMKKHGLI